MKFMQPNMLLKIALLLTIGLIAGGCNTTQGLGEDIEVLGDTIEEKAKEKKSY